MIILGRKAVPPHMHTRKISITNCSKQTHYNELLVWWPPGRVLDKSVIYKKLLCEQLPGKVSSLFQCNDNRLQMIQHGPAIRSSRQLKCQSHGLFALFTFDELNRTTDIEMNSFNSQNSKLLTESEPEN